MTGLMNALKARDPEQVARIASDWWKISVTVKEAEKLCKRWFKRPAGYSDGWAAMWLKVQLISLNKFQAPHNHIENDRIGCELNVCFLYLEESEDMLALLRLTNTEDDSAIRRHLQKRVRSKIWETSRIPRPVDGVALRVARPPERKGK